MSWILYIDSKGKFSKIKTIKHIEVSICWLTQKISDLSNMLLEMISVTARYRSNESTKCNDSRVKGQSFPKYSVIIKPLLLFLCEFTGIGRKVSVWNKKTIINKNNPLLAQHRNWKTTIKLGWRQMRL